MALLPLALTVLATIFGCSEGPCIEEDRVLTCRGAVLLVEIPRSSTVKSVFLVSLADSSCFTAASIRTRCPQLNLVAVLGSMGVCQCLLSTNLPCGVVLDGCTTSPLQGVCPPIPPRHPTHPAARNGTSESLGTTSPVVVATSALASAAILSVGIIAAVFAWRKWVGHGYQTAANETTMSTIPLRDASLFNPDASSTPIRPTGTWQTQPTVRPPRRLVTHADVTVRPKRMSAIEEAMATSELPDAPTAYETPEQPTDTHVIAKDVTLEAGTSSDIQHEDEKSMAERAGRRRQEGRGLRPKPKKTEKYKPRWR